MKDKKKILAAITVIVSALQKGYNLLNEDEQLPEVSKEDLPALGLHIFKALNIQLVELEDNARFEGLTYEQILEKKDAEKQEAIKRNLEAAGEELKKLKGVEAEPELIVPGFAGIQIHPGNPTDQKESDTIDEGEGEGYTLKTLLTVISDLEKDLKTIDVNSELFQEKTKELDVLRKLLKEGFVEPVLV